MLEECPRELLLHRWDTLQHRRESDEVKEDFIEGFGEILLVGTVQNLPILPEDLGEDLLSDVLILNVVLGVDPNDLGQRLHQVAQIGLLRHVLSVLVVEGSEGCEDLLSIL